MEIAQCQIIRLDIPFRRKFAHASAARASSDTILILLSSDTGLVGIGEILAREYVSGETNDQIFRQTGRDIARTIVGKKFNDAEELSSFILENFTTPKWGPALFGGFELALLSLSAQQFETDIAGIVGPLRKKPTQRITTVGLSQPLTELQYAARQSGASRPAVIKVKVVDAESAARVEQVSTIFNHQLPIRLDANGVLDADEAGKLLAACRTLPIQSLEQPFAADADNLAEILADLYDNFEIPLVADESVCGIQDLKTWIKAGGYQGVNVRVGKAGGLLAARRQVELAAENGLDVVAGTMVGESPVLNQASEILLSRSDELAYVEGLGQYHWLLSVRPVHKVSSTAAGFEIFELSDDVVTKFGVGLHEVSS